jgi:hypothetical protein
MKIFFTACTKQATLIRRSTVLSLPTQFVFPACTQVAPSGVNVVKEPGQ